MTDRRTQRHEATRREILDAAWGLAREHGLTGWSLRALADAVGMRAPSLYVYFESKDAIYNAMFADGYEQMRAVDEALDLPDDPEDALRVAARAFVEFYVADPARSQLLFQRVVPGFEPSEESYALARHALDSLAELLTAAGIHRPEARDLLTALLSGLASQQASNDPGGDRWLRLVDEAIDMFLASELAPRR